LRALAKRPTASIPEELPTERLLELLQPIEDTIQGRGNQLQQVVGILRSRDVSWGDVGSYLYFYPLQRNSLEKDRLVQLASEHVLELAIIAGLAGAREPHKRLSSLTTVWIDNDRERGPMPQDLSSLDIGVYETIGDFIENSAEPRLHWSDGLLRPTRDAALAPTQASSNPASACARSWRSCKRRMIAAAVSSTERRVTSMTGQRWRAHSRLECAISLAICARST
jgi:hypothetical protein